MRIGPYTLPALAVLAPMAGVTDRPFRILCRRLGAGLAASEMLTSDMRLWHTAKSRHRMDHTGEPEPRVVQLAGAEPGVIAEAARRNVDLGAQIIDINMGCPAKKVCGRLCGSALLRDEALVAAILQAVVRAVSVPVTLKIRTGWDRSSVNGVRIAMLAERCGVQALAVHGRTRADRYEGHAEYDTIRFIKSAVQIPVLANGDIDSASKARQVLDFTGADGVMIGRASHGAPWIFAEVNAGLTGGAAAALAPAKVRAIILEHLESLYAFYGEVPGVRIARKHLSWYCGRLSDPERVRHAILAAEDAAGQFELTKNYFDGWVELIGRPEKQAAADEVRGANMVARKNGRTRREFTAKSNGKELPLRTHTERALNDYFASLNGHRPAHLYDLVLREVEEPLLKAVLDYTEGNQVRAADILGINRGTLRKKLRLHGIAG